MNAKYFLVGIAVSLAIDIAHAEASNHSNRFLIGANIGNAIHQQTSLNPDTLEDNGNSFAMNLDYFLSKRIAIGFGYTDLGETTLTNISSFVQEIDSTMQLTTKTEAQGFTASALYQMNFNDSSWGGFIRAGVIKWGIDETSLQEISGAINEISESKRNEDGVDLFIGLGFTYDISDRLQLGLTANWYELPWDAEETTINGDGSVIMESVAYQEDFSVYSIGLSYSF